LRDLVRGDARGLDLALAVVVERADADAAHDEADDREHDHDLDEGHTRVAHALPFSLHSCLSFCHCTNCPMSMIGPMIENTMKPTPTAIMTIISGASSDVRRPTSTSTSRS